MGRLAPGPSSESLLRRQLRDRELPPVIWPGSFPHTNWDDYYLGALQEFLEENEA